VPFSINLLDNDDLGNPTATFRLTSISPVDCNLTSAPESGIIAGTCLSGGTVDGAYVLENSVGSDTASVSFTTPQ
jgi:hypothetical protein